MLFFTVSDSRHIQGGTYDGACGVTIRRSDSGRMRITSFVGGMVPYDRAADRVCAESCH
jgi:hypothetical protein